MSKSENITIHLSEKEISILLDILYFSQTAANVLSHEEMKKGGSIAVAQRMTRISRDASTFYKIFFTHMDIGEPPTDIFM